MSVITLTTVGFGEVKPLSGAGRGFTTFYILLGFGSLALAGRAIAESLIENVFSGQSEIKKMKKKISLLKAHFIICGFGRVGAASAEHFIKDGADFIVIENDHEQCHAIREKDYIFLEGDATSEAILLEAGIKSAKGLIALLNSDPKNLFIVLSARELNPTLQIISRVEDASSEKKILRAGADRVISPFAAAGRQIAGDILAATEKTAHRSETKKVVIVDDNPVILRLYTRLFQKAGFHPITAINGREGVDTIISEKPAAAVIDYMLPELSGIEVCRHIRTTQGCRGIKLIIFTADDQAKTKRRAIDAGADAVIIKSPEASEVIEAVVRIIKEDQIK